MPAQEKIKSIHKLAVLAGAGDLPVNLIRSCEEMGIDVHVIAFEGQTSEDLIENRPHLKTGLGMAGVIITYLKKNKITDLVMAGAIKRPSLLSLKTDLRGAQIVARIGLLGAIGDNSILESVKKILESEGFTLHGAHLFLPDLLAGEGSIGRTKPDENDLKDIAYGFKVSQELGRLDIGQSVVVQQGIVLGVEGIEGTDALIERCAKLQKKGRGAILVKSCKPQQDRDMDLPTIGINTLINIHKFGFRGIAFHAGNSILLNQDEIVKKSDQYKLFVYGIKEH